jgi:hypothetical protein
MPEWRAFGMVRCPAASQLLQPLTLATRNVEITGG